MIPPLTPTKRVLKRISPLSCGKIAGAIYATLGLIFIPFFLLMMAASAAMPEGQRGPFVALGGMFALFMPVIYGALGFIFGVLGAALYNLFAGWMGGLEIEVT